MTGRFTRGFLPKASPVTKELWKLEKVHNGLVTILVAKEPRHSKMVLPTMEISLIGCRITWGQWFTKMVHHTMANSSTGNFKAKALWNLQTAQLTKANTKMDYPTDRASRKAKMAMFLRENILMVYRMDRAKEGLQMGKLTLEHSSKGWSRGKGWLCLQMAIFTKENSAMVYWQERVLLRPQETVFSVGNFWRGTQMMGKRGAATLYSYKMDFLLEMGQSKVRRAIFTLVHSNGASP